MNSNSSSITEWIQAIGSLIAAIGLVWTLYLQVKATRAQVDATKYSYLTYIKNIQPKFRISIFLSKGGARGSVSVMRIENEYKELKVISEFRDVVVEELNYYEHDISGTTYNFQVDIGNRLLKGTGFNVFSFIITYQDANGNFYKQAVSASGEDSDEEQYLQVTQYPPVLV